jgi:NAD(P)-dependent dehydrogenase (short-subunit alcohol dehydrogenase family)
VTRIAEKVLEGKVALITGAGRGIGRAVALAYAERGARLALCSRTARELESTAREVAKLGAQVVPVVTDVSQPIQVETLVNRAVGEFGRIDVLVNNAGVAHAELPLAALPVEEWHQVLAVNLTGAYLVARAVIPHMVKQRSGSVINVSSWLGRASLAGYGAYGVSKWGVEGLTRYLAMEVRRFRVRVNSVSPGVVATRMTGGRGTKPGIVVPLFVYLASDDSARVTGRALDVKTWRRVLGVRRSP